MSLDVLQKSAIDNISIGNLGQGAKLLRTCLEIVGVESGVSSLDFAQAQFSLALCLFQLPGSDYNEIYLLTKDALATRLATKGRVDTTVAICADFFGTVCERMGKFDEAETAFRLSLENALVLVGSVHIKTGTAQLNLARILLTTSSQLSEAQELANKAVSIRRKFFGNESAETLAAVDLLNVICQKTGETCIVESTVGPSQNLMK